MLQSIPLLPGNTTPGWLLATLPIKIVRMIVKTNSFHTVPNVSVTVVVTLTICDTVYISIKITVTIAV
jgi:hypothetical protein